MPPDPCQQDSDIGARLCAESGVEFWGHPMGGGHPDIVRQQGIHGPLQPLRGPAGRHPDPHPLSVGMHPGVGPASTHHRGRRIAQGGQNTLHLPLNRAGVRLPLPPGEATAVVLRHEEDRVGLHEIRKVRHPPPRFNRARPAYCIAVAEAVFSPVS